MTSGYVLHEHLLEYILRLSGCFILSGKQTEKTTTPIMPFYRLSGESS